MIKAQLMVYGSLIVTMHLTTGTTSVRKDHMIWFEVMNEVINVRPILATLTAQNADRYIATMMINHMLHQCIWLSALLCTWHTVPTLKAKVTIIITNILAKYIPSPLELVGAITSVNFNIWTNQIKKRALPSKSRNDNYTSNRVLPKFFLSYVWGVTSALMNSATSFSPMYIWINQIKNLEINKNQNKSKLKFFHL